jgi:hypothetical protein
VNPSHHSVRSSPRVQPVQRYRIPCSCSAAAVVGAGQAGGVVSCPGCGGSLPVPRLRDLGPYAEAGPAPAGPRSRRGRGLLLTGLAIVVGSAATALAVERYAAAVVERLPDEPTIRTGVGQADTKTIYEVWKMMRQAGVNRGPLPDEIHAQRTAVSTERIARLLWITAAGGAALALVGLGRGLLSGSGNGGRLPREGA